MEIITTKNDGVVTMSLTGRLDTSTSSKLETELKSLLEEGTTSLIFDFSGLEYLSSSGLRVILLAQKAMNKQGKLVLTGVNEVIMEIFEITGFVNILTFE